MKKIIILLLSVFWTTFNLSAEIKKITINFDDGTTYRELNKALTDYLGVGTTTDLLNVTVKGTHTSAKMIAVSESGYMLKQIQELDCRDLIPQYVGRYIYTNSKSLPNLRVFRMPLQINASNVNIETVDFTDLKIWHIPENVKGFSGSASYSPTKIESIYMDNPTPFSTTVFNGMGAANVAKLYVPEGSESAYAAAAPWSGMGEIRTRRKVIFHLSDNTTDRVSFTYNGGVVDGEQQYYWYSNVDELMEKPQMDEGAAVIPTWYKDEELTQPFDFDAETVPASADPANPTPLHLYASWNAKSYYHIKLHWNYDGKDDSDDELEENTVLAAVISANPSRRGYSFAGWYETEDFQGEAFNIGITPSIDPDTHEEITDGVVYLTTDLELYAKWEEKPWLYEPLLVEIPEGSTLQAAFTDAFATRAEHTDKTFAEIYGIASLEIRGTIEQSALLPYYNCWYVKNLRDKVLKLDLREAAYPAVSPGGEDYSATFALMGSSIVNEIRLPVGNIYSAIGDAFHMTYSVQKLYLPASVTSLSGDDCNAPFSYTPLKELYIDASAPPAYSAGLWHSFSGGTTIYVPEGLKDDYEAQTWSNGSSVWTTKSPEEGGTALNNTIAERPKVTFHTNGGSRPLYTYTASEADAYYWYVNADATAYSNTSESVPATEQEGYVFTGWYSDAELTTSYTDAPVALGTGGLDLYAGWAENTSTGLSPALTGNAVKATVYYNLYGVPVGKPVVGGIYIRKDVYASGEVKTAKVVVK
jgi:uncharacterized repeat protein (TIGR02543 family)